MLVLLATELALARLNAKKLSGSTTTNDHEEWLKDRQIVSCVPIAEIERVIMLAKENMLSIEEAYFNFFYRFFRIRNKKKYISMLEDSQG